MTPPRQGAARTAPSDPLSQLHGLQDLRAFVDPLGPSWNSLGRILAAQWQTHACSWIHLGPLGANFFHQYRRKLEGIFVVRHRRNIATSALVRRGRTFELCKQSGRQQSSAVSVIRHTSGEARILVSVLTGFLRNGSGGRNIGCQPR